MTLTVRNKLILLAALATGGIALVGGSSQLEMARVYTAASFANDNTVPSLLALHEATAALTAQRVKFWQILAQTDPAVAAKLRQEIQAARTNVEAAFKKYETELAGDKDRALLAADRSTMGDYYTLIDKALALAAENHKVEARDLVMQNQAVAYAPVEAFEAHRRYNQDLGAAGSADAARIKSTASYIAIAIGLVVGGLVLLVAFFIIRNLTRALDQAVRILAEIERGNYDSVVTIATHDETGKVLASLETMQRSLNERTQRDRERAESERARIEGELAAAAENVRIRIALDRVSVGVMLADNDGKIIYTNDFGTNIFRTRASDIRKQLPQFDAERIVGTSFDTFHRVPSHQRNMLAGLRGTHTADIKMGDATLRVIANPVVDAAGTRLGTVVQWLDRTQEIAIEEEVGQIVGEAVEGNLTARIQEEGKEGFFRTLADGVNRLIGSTAEVMGTIANAAAEVGTGAEEISRGNADLSQRTEQQASSLEQTAASMEQMTAAVKNNADNAAQANQLARAARDQAEQGGAVVQSAVLAMSEINASSRKIADIIGVIDDIAFQTNLLALNAAVEAARAGEQGRGFAVVASEVRNLASRSAAAAKEIKGLIQESVGKVDEGTKLVDASGKVLNDIVAGVKKVTDVVAEIAASSQEQASGIEQVNKAVMSMDEGTQQNAALVEQATAAAQSLNQQAANLTQMMSRFQVGGGSSALPVSARAPAAGSVKASPAHKPAAKAHSPERRGPNRAFAKAPVKPASTSPAAAPRADASAGADADWQQF